MLNNVSFIKGQGGLGRPLPGKDYISGLVYYCADNKLPAGFSTGARVKQFFQPSDATAAGINSNFSDETQATGTYLVTNAGAAGTRATCTNTVTLGTTGDTAQILVNGVITSAPVIQTVTETTAALMATKIAAAITAAAGTNGGYTATAAGAVITISAPVIQGSNVNGVSTTFVYSAGATLVIVATTAFTGGVFPSSGDVVLIQVTEYNGNEITIGTYVKPVTDYTTTAVAAGIAAAINAATASNGGYTATVAGSTVTYKARKGLGVSLNTGTPVEVTISVGSTVAGTLVQFSGGVASLQAVWAYHINEFFRIQPQGQLFVGFFTTPIGAPTYNEVALVQTAAKGACRQFGVYKDFTAYNAVTDTTAIQTVVQGLDVLIRNNSVLLGADISGVADISTVYDLSTLTNNKASVVIGQDGAALGAQLFAAYGKSITCLGATLGAVALAAVNEDIAWVAKFNLSNGTELDTIAFANGVLMSDPSISANLLGLLNDRRYIFLRTFPNVSGSYVNDSNCACPVDSDYAYIENNRTIDKAIRGVYAGVVPSLNSPIVLNADGTLTDDVLNYFENIAGAPLSTMVNAAEISAYSVTIDPTQNIASTSILYITIKIVPVGVARNIIVNIGFTTSIS